MDAVAAFRVLSGQDKDAEDFIRRYAAVPATERRTASAGTQMSIGDAIRRGLRQETKTLTAQALEQMSEMDVVDRLLIPAPDAVGDCYERQEIFLPQLINAANAACEGFELVKKRIAKRGGSSVSKGKIVLATVHGDIHDIGKTIVAAFLRNAGFEVIDLGCEVSVEAIALAAREFNVDIIGTSALLTASLKEQKKLEKYLRDIGERDRYITMVGGAPCTERWAEKIGADGYSETASEAVEKALELIQRKKQNGSE